MNKQWRVHGTPSQWARHYLEVPGDMDAAMVLDEGINYREHAQFRAEVYVWSQERWYIKKFRQLEVAKRWCEALVVMDGSPLKGVEYER